MSNIPCDNCLHKDVCKYEEQIRNHIKWVDESPIPMALDSLGVEAKCGFHMLRVENIDISEMKL